MCWHRNLLLGRNRILRSPQTRHGLPLRVKVDSTFSVKVARTASCHRRFVAREAEHGQRYGNGDIDSLLASFDFFLKARRSGARSGEDRCAVAVWVSIDEGDGFVNCGDIEADEDGAEDLFGVALHMWFDVCDDGWADLWRQ